MKIENLAKALSKINIKLEIDSTKLKAITPGGHGILEAWKNSDSLEVDYVNIRAADDVSCVYTDYHAGLTYSTIKSIVAAMEYHEKLGIEKAEVLSKNSIESITLIRHEGPTKLCGIKHSFKSIKELNDFIIEQTHTYPNMGYDKHSLRINFKDGLSFGDRLDLQHFSNKYYSFKQCNFGEYLDSMILATGKYHAENRDRVSGLEIECFNTMKNTLKRLRELKEIA